METDLQELIQLLANNGFASTDMTDDELAKEHIRYMVCADARQFIG